MMLQDRSNGSLEEQKRRERQEADINARMIESLDGVTRVASADDPGTF